MHFFNRLLLDLLMRILFSSRSTRGLSVIAGVKVAEEKRGADDSPLEYEYRRGGSDSISSSKYTGSGISLIAIYINIFNFG